MRLEQAVFTGSAESRDSRCSGPEPCPVLQGNAVTSKIFSLLPGFIYIFNHGTGRNEYWSGSIGNVLGYDEEELRGMGDDLLARVVDPSHARRVARHIVRLRRLAPGERRACDFLCRARDGRPLWLRSMDAALDFDADGRVIRHIGIATDITARKEAEQGLKDMNRQLEARVAAHTEALRQLNGELEHRLASRTAHNREMVQELSELAHIATHSLKVPVANMCSLVHSLLQARADIPPEHRDTLDWLAEAGEQARQTLDALVRVAVTRDARAEPSQRIDLPGLVGDVLAAMHEPIAAASARVRLDSGSVRHVAFGPRTLETALRTLIKNALTYAQEGRRLDIAITLSRAPGQVRLTVADNGRGLNPDRDRAKVFGLFKRAHASPPGLGVELYCSDMMIRRQGGFMDVGGTPGQGAVFTLVLPDPEGDMSCRK